MRTAGSIYSSLGLGGNRCPPGEVTRHSVLCDFWWKVPVARIGGRRLTARDPDTWHWWCGQKSSSWRKVIDRDEWGPSRRLCRRLSFRSTGLSRWLGDMGG